MQNSGVHTGSLFYFNFILPGWVCKFYYMVCEKVSIIWTEKENQTEIMQHILINASNFLVAKLYYMNL
jgi:hypothetical protein